MDLTPHDTLTFELIRHDGRPAWLTSTGRILPYVAGGDGPEGDGGEGGDGTGSEGEGPGQGSGSGEPGATDGGDGEGEGEAAEKLTLTQAELDHMIDKRLGRAKTKWETDLKGYADAENQTETERLQAEKEAADQRAAEIAERANQKLILADAKMLATSKDYGVPADRVAAFIKLADLSDVDVDDDGNVDTKALATAIKATLDEHPFLKDTGTNGRNGSSGGEFNGGTAPVTSDDFAKMSYQDRVQLHRTNPDLYEQLSAAT